MSEVASREFIDNLTSLLKAYGPAAVEENVKNKILELIQNWASAAEGRMNLIYISETYRTLLMEGFKFPPKVEVGRSMFDTTAPPEWADSDVCMRCRTPFSFTNRKHHCRNCGNVFDANCSSKTIPLPHLGILQPVRVDDGCYAKLTEKSGQSGAIPQHGTGNHGGSRTLYQGSMQPRDARVDDSFDAELKKALAMSLQESQGSVSGSSFTPLTQQPTRNPPGKINGTSRKVKEDDDDPEFAAAIAASLADMEEQKTKHVATLRQRSSTGQSTTPAAPVRRSEHELSPVEAENINLFSTLVDRLQHQPSGMILREPQIQELYDSIGSLRPKLARTYGETMSKYETLVDLHNKLSTVVRYYDRMLEERLNSTFQQGSHSYGNYGAVPPRTTSMYPNIPANGGSAPPINYAPSGPESYYSSQPAPAGPYTHPRASYGQPAHQQYSQAPQSAQKQHYTQPSHTPQSSDPAAAYYSGQTEQYTEPQTLQAHHTGASQLQYAQQASQQQQYPPAYQPQEAPPMQQYQSSGLGQYQQPQQQNQLPAQHAQAQQLQYQVASGNVASFPAAPSHQSQAAPAVEESLIEL